MKKRGAYIPDLRRARDEAMKQIEATYRDMKRAEMLLGKKPPTTLDLNSTDFPNREWDQIARILHEKEIISRDNTAYWTAAKEAEKIMQAEAAKVKPADLPTDDYPRNIDGSAEGHDADLG